MIRFIATVLCAGCLAAPLAAGDPAPFPDFKAKRIKPPGRSSAKPRITVQIDPAAAPAPVAEAPVEASPPPAARYGWFWETVPDDLAQAGPGRLDGAMQSLAAAARPVPAPRLQHLQELARAHGVDILTATVGTEVSPAIVLAVMSVESAGKVDALSAAGAQGLMQLMPATAERFGVSDAFSARANIQGGVKYLDWLMREFKGDPLLALAGYNAGEGAVRSHGGVPPFAETRDYVPKVLAAFSVARGLCLTPPQFASDGCVFAGLN